MLNDLRFELSFKNNCSLEDFSIISLKHFQLLVITIPAQAVHKPKTNPDNNKVKFSYEKQ